MSESHTLSDTTTNDRATPVTDRIEVRLLGPLRVRRTDGSLVDPHEWRTGKTADLVRLLALHVGQAVPVDTLIEDLWPHVDDQRGRASLRTAASQIRRVLGADCLRRSFGGLEIRDVWVDASAFSSLAREVRRLADAGQAAAAVTTAREADALYLADFRAHGDGEDWALSARAELAKTYRELMRDAADASAELGWMRDAAEFAGRAVGLDPYCEQSYRTLMRAHAALGETSQALRDFESCRTFLADELGADPSPETRALHVQLLKTPIAERPEAPFVGRRDAVEQLKSIIDSTRRAGQSAVFAVIGAPGVGKSSLLVEACREAAVQLVVRSCEPVDGRPADCLDLLERALGCRMTAHVAGPDLDPIVVVLDRADLAPPSGIQSLVDAVHGSVGALTLVLTARVTDTDPNPLSHLAPSRPAPHAVRPHRLELPAFTSEDVGELAARLLAGEPSSELVRALVSETDAVPGRVLSKLRDWVSTGRIAATAGGLVVMPRGAGRTTEHATKRLAPLLEQLNAFELGVLQLVAVIDGPADRSVLIPLLDDGTQKDPGPLRSRVQQALDRLVDLSVLTPQPTGYVFRDPLLRDAVESWLRPGARRGLHRRVAEQGFISTAARVGHWLKAGETQLARAAALAAVAEAMGENRYEDARAHLMRVCSLGPMHEALPADRADLFERLGDVCSVLGRRHEARAAFSVALNVARSHSLPHLSRVAAKRENVSDVDWFQEDENGVEQVSPPAPYGHQDDLGETWSPAPDDEHRLRASLETADRLSDPRARAEARLRLSTAVCTPRRQFGLGRLWAQEAMGITVEPRLRARALVASWLPGVLMGQAQLAEQPLELAGELAGSSGDQRLHRRVQVLQCLVAHDLGRPDIDERLAVASAACEADTDAHWTWIQVRIATERGDLNAAQATDETPAVAGEMQLAEQLRVLTSAALHAELGDVSGAVERLLSVVAMERKEGSSLLLPETFARLITLRAPYDVLTAKADFELLDRSVGGDHGFPREQCLRLLARAAIRSANGQHDEAAAAATNAAEVAMSSALPCLAAHAQLSVGRYLSRSLPPLRAPSTEASATTTDAAPRRKHGRPLRVSS